MADAQTRSGNNSSGLDGSAEVVNRIIEVKEGVWSILVGTIVKETDAKRRPPVESSYHSSTAHSFLFPSGDETSGKVNQESLRSYLFDSEKGDVLHLEDESGRVELLPLALDGMTDATNALDPNKVATGCVAAVIGKVSAENGVMQVHSVHFAGPPPPENKSSTTKSKSSAKEQISDEPVLLLISGLGCGSDSPDDVSTGGSLALRREMLLEYLAQPNLGSGESICRMIVAGGGVAPPTSPSNESPATSKETLNGGKTKKSYNDIAKSKSAESKSISEDTTSQLASSLRELDIFYSEILSSGIPIDYIPGWHDPTNANWPQRPIHSCLLPHSCSFIDLFGRSTNPYEGILEATGSDGEGVKVIVLGSDGLNVADLRRFLAIKTGGQDDVEMACESGSKGDSTSNQMTSSMDALHQTLRFGHMAPTGPDSLPTFPSSESDPFVIETRPTIYFAGNCEKFETRLVSAHGEEIDEANAMDVDGGHSATRLVCIPSFALTGEVVLVKLNSLECEVVAFNDVIA